jgi:hypothetical protein
MYKEGKLLLYCLAIYIWEKFKKTLLGKASFLSELLHSGLERLGLFFELLNVPVGHIFDCFVKLGY